jgi:hypothetical protein
MRKRSRSFPGTRAVAGEESVDENSYYEIVRMASTKEQEREMEASGEENAA